MGGSGEGVSGEGVIGTETKQINKVNEEMLTKLKTKTFKQCNSFKTTVEK